MNLDFSPYATGGAAARADSFTRLDPNFATGVYGLTQAAHAAGIPLQITSAYRSPELQAQLYASALERYGSPQAARRWVAPPGRSQHNYGTAVDFALNGSLLRDADSPAAQFIRNNAEQYGLSVPMDWEPWQVEPVGSRDGSRPQATVNTRNAPTNTQTTGVQMDDTQQSGGDLSRNQRMMLGFAALRDAGAALQGQNSNFFADTMGGFQQQAQAADDRAFRQMQFDRGVTEFDERLAFDRAQAAAGSSLPTNVLALQMRAEMAGLLPGTPEYQQYMELGGPAPAAFTSLDMQARAAGYTPGDGQYEKFMQTRGAGERATAVALAEAGVTDEIKLAELQRGLPELRNIVGELSDLGEVASYRFLDTVADSARRQRGEPMTEGAIARAQYTATIDNYILPLLKQTFGAAFTAVEGERLRATLGNEDLSPQEKQAALNAFISAAEREIRTLGGVVPEATPDPTDTSGRSDEELLEFYLGGGQ